MLRTSKGWTQAELAKRLGVTTRTVFTYENGTYPRQQSRYEALARVFDVDVDYLRGEQEEFFTQVTERYGMRGQVQAKAILEQTAQLFAGGTLSDEDEIAFLRDIQDLYLDSKRQARKYAPKKFKTESSGMGDK